MYLSCAEHDPHDLTGADIGRDAQMVHSDPSNEVIEYLQQRCAKEAENVPDEQGTFIFPKSQQRIEAVTLTGKFRLM